MMLCSKIISFLRTIIGFTISAEGIPAIILYGMIPMVPASLLLTAHRKVRDWEYVVCEHNTSNEALKARTTLAS